MGRKQRRGRCLGPQEDVPGARSPTVTAAQRRTAASRVKTACGDDRKHRSVRDTFEVRDIHIKALGDELLTLENVVRTSRVGV